MNKILFLDFCNYEDYPIGGFLSFAKNMVSAFGNDLTLVGITTSKYDPVGQWFKKNINGVVYDYFALTRYNKSKTKHIIPDRLICFLLLKYYKRIIFGINIQNVFIQRHEILPAIKSYRFKNICYRFPGMESPLKISKYWFGKYFEKQFNKIFFSSFKNVKVILAAGDNESIEEMVTRSEGAILRKSVIDFPTRINTDIYRPIDILEARKKLKIPLNSTIIITIGRLATLKGWDLMIDSFFLFQQNIPECYFYMIGSGEDINKIQEYISLLNLNQKVILAGEKKMDEISLFLNASNLFIMGSHREGWSTSLLEAIACGIPACVTNFSSSREIIIEGKNGYVIGGYNKSLFVKGMLKAMQISRPVYNDNIQVFAVNRLREELLKIWELI
ncbi:UDP-N-acetylglucosamine--peptide N-acetylglucosaminyltransferase GtfA subunit [subsurface metagenome]